MIGLLRGLLARRIIRRRIAKRVLACFAGVDLTRQQFVANGVKFTVKGEDTFYAAGEIDIAIDRINALLAELRS